MPWGVRCTVAAGTMPTEAILVASAAPIWYALRLASGTSSPVVVVAPPVWCGRPQLPTVSPLYPSYPQFPSVSPIPSGLVQPHRRR